MPETTSVIANKPERHCPEEFCRPSNLLYSNVKIKLMRGTTDNNMQHFPSYSNFQIAFEDSPFAARSLALLVSDFHSPSIE